MDELLQYIEQLDLRFSIEPNPENPNQIISKIYKSGEEVGEMHCFIIEDALVTVGKTRNAKKMEVSGINVNWITIHDGHKRNGYGSILLLYTLNEICKINPHLQYIILDDDSDSTNKTSNIYSSIGFESSELVSIDMHSARGKTVKLTGPEKQLYIHTFNENVDILANNLMKKLMKKLKKSKGGYTSKIKYKSRKRLHKKYTFKSR